MKARGGDGAGGVGGGVAVETICDADGWRDLDTGGSGAGPQDSEAPRTPATAHVRKEEPQPGPRCWLAPAAAAKGQPWVCGPGQGPSGRLAPARIRNTLAAEINYSHCSKLL